MLALYKRREKSVIGATPFRGAAIYSSKSEGPTTRRDRRRSLLDRVSGAYRALPRGTRVYVNDANEAGVKVTPLSLWKDRLPISNPPNIPKAEARVEKKEAPKLHF
jgi:hypothetical protein